MNMHLNERTVATDTIYYSTTYISDGSACDQIFVGTKSLVSYVYGMKIDKQSANNLEDNICELGYMSKLIRDCSWYELRNLLQSILRILFIDDWKSEPHYQHNNVYENWYQKIKRLTNTILYHMGALDYT